jgi:di/tricarboxylate transporter
MNPETLNAILVFLGAVVVAVLFVLDRSGKRLNESIPAEVLPLFMGLLALAETLAKETPTLDQPPAPEPPTVTEIIEGAQG